MKKIILFLTLAIIFSFNGQSQSMTKTELRNSDTWMISVGVNALGSLGTRNPFKRLDEFEFSRPIAIAIQHKWYKFLSIEQDFTLNKFKSDSKIDNGDLPRAFSYFSTNTYVKYYYSDELFPEVTWLDTYVGGGFGLFTVDELNTSANLVLGGTAWVSDNIGIRLQCVGKFAFNHKDNRYDNNHFQYMLQAIFKL